MMGEKEVHVRIVSFQGGLETDPLTAGVTVAIILFLAYVFLTVETNEMGLLLGWFLVVVATGIVVFHVFLMIGRMVFTMDARGATMRERGRTVHVDFGPDVTAEVMRDHEDEGAWEGVAGFYFQGGERITVCVPEFDPWWIRNSWPAFMWVVRMHGMRTGPYLTAMLERAEA